MALQVPVTFEDLAVKFSADEWHLLEEWQREFHRDVMRENYETLVSLGTAQLLPLSAFLSLTEPQEVMENSGCSDGAWEKPGGGFQGKELEIPDADARADFTQRAQALDEAQSSGGAGEVDQQQGSLHLNALVRLVKEIPEFLFGENKAMDTPETPENRESGSEGERLSLEALTVDSSPLQGLLNCLPEIPISRPALAVTPASSSSNSSLQGDGDQELGPQTLYPYEPAAKSSPLNISRNPGGKEDPKKSASQPNTFGFTGTQEQKQLGTLGQGSPSESSPLQGLINCLKEILVQGPQHPQALATGSLPQSNPGDMTLMTPDQRPRGPPWAVKAETISENSPLQGLLNCLKEIPETQARCASHPGGEVQQQKDGPGTWQKDSGVKMEGTTEDAWAESPQSYIPDTPTPVSCELSALTHGSSTSSSVEGDGNLRGPEVPGWTPVNQVGGAQSSPLEALETYLKDIPLNRSLRPQPLGNYWCLSPGHVETFQRRSDPRAQKWHAEAVITGSLPSLGPHGCVKDLSAHQLGPLNTPTSLSSASSTDGDLDLRSPEGIQGRWCREASPIESSPLQGLENCLKEISTNRPHLSQPATLLAPAGDGISRRLEPRSWTSDREGLGGEPHGSLCPRQGGKEVPSESLNLGSPQSRVSSSFTHHQTGNRNKTSETRPWAASKPSPLRCLENSLRGILAMRPLRFTCLASPSLSSSSSPSSSHSSNSSSSSSSGGGSEGEDHRLEPELWRVRLKERSLFPVPRGPASQASSYPSPFTSSTNSPATNKGQRRTEPGDWRALDAALKAEETSGSHPRFHGKNVPAETSTPSNTETGPSADSSSAPDREEAPDVPTPRPSSGGPEVDEEADGPKAVPGELSVASPKDTKPDTPEAKARDLTGLVLGAEAIPKSSPPETPEGIQSWAGTSALTSQDTPSPPRPDGGAKHLCSLHEPTASCSAAQTGKRTSNSHIHGPAETPSKTPRLALPPMANAPPTLPVNSPWSSCHCGDALRGELHNLGAALTEQMNRLSSALVTLSQDMSAMKNRMKLLGRDFRSHQRLGRGSRPWTFCRRYQKCCHSVRRHRLRQKKPTQPQPLQFGGQPKGLGVGDTSNFLQRGPHMVPQLPPVAPPGVTPMVLTTPFGPNSSSSPSSLLLSPTCSTLLTVHSPQRQMEDYQSPTVISSSQIAPPPSPEEGFKCWQELEQYKWKSTMDIGMKGAWSQKSKEPSSRRPGEVSTKAQHGGPG